MNWPQSLFTYLGENLLAIHRIPLHRDQVMIFVIVKEAPYLVPLQVLAEVVIALVPAHQLQLAAVDLLRGPVVELNHLYAAHHGPFPRHPEVKILQLLKILQHSLGNRPEFVVANGEVTQPGTVIKPPVSPRGQTVLAQIEVFKLDESLKIIHV